jgi:hypothetical protein
MRECSHSCENYQGAGSGVAKFLNTLGSPAAKMAEIQPVPLPGNAQGVMARMMQ